MKHYTKYKIFTLLGISSIIIGGMIYIIFREQNILMFRWFKLLKISSITDLTRNYGRNLIQELPTWIVYSVPMLLYLLGGNLLFLVIWQGKDAEKYWINSFSGLIILSEFGQAVNVVPGTYSHLDLITIIFSYIFIHIIIIKIYVVVVKYYSII